MKIHYSAQITCKLKKKKLRFCLQSPVVHITEIDSGHLTVKSMVIRKIV